MGRGCFQEVERALHVDPHPTEGFLLNIDTKWATHPDPETTPREQWKGHECVAELYVLGIVRDGSLRTLRDLRGRHVPLLRKLLTVGRATIVRAPLCSFPSSALPVRSLLRSACAS